MWRRSLGLVLVLTTVLAGPVRAQERFTSSHLPIVFIDTQGQAIPDEPKITARMGIVDNGPGTVNHVSDPRNGYDGWIGIEVRGSSTQMFPKKQYAVETRDADGENLNVSLLGLPEENDWVLNAPYSDKSLLRNVLAYHVARRTGRYASRTRWCEVVLNGRYQGVYVLMEKIKRDRHRVDIATLNPDETTGDDVTGGYVLKIDKWDGRDNEGWPSSHRPPARRDREILYQYHDPSPSELVPEQKAYIRQYVEAFEDMMAGEAYADPDRGYPQWLDVASFVDYVIVQELSRNVDGYRLSAFLYKDKDSNDGRLVMGPAWDFNLAFGNADYYDGSSIRGWQVDFAVPTDDFHIPFWWRRLLQDSLFARTVETRWWSLRQGALHVDSLHAFIDAQVAALGAAQARNFQRWPILDQYVWPNNYVGGTYDREVDYLKRWIRDRVAWIDEHVADLQARSTGTGPRPVETFDVSGVYPSPTTGPLAVSVSVGFEQRVEVTVYDALGRRVTVLYDGSVPVGEEVELRSELHGTPPGVYFIRVAGAGPVRVRPFVLVR